MPRTYVLPYKSGSRSARRIADELNVRVIGLNRSTVHRQEAPRIINWGNSGTRLPPQGLPISAQFFNTPEAVQRASNKLTTFESLKMYADIPAFTTDPQVAIQWLEDGHKVVERHTLTGNSGEGIRIVHNEEPVMSLQQAPLYVKYIKKQDEYRVHVAQCPVSGSPVVFDVQKKLRSTSVPDEQVNWQVRNTAGGFIFARGFDRSTVPDKVLNNAKKALTALGLDFGAVDIVWNNREQKAYVLEVNTAPGLEGTTLENYKTMLTCLVERIRIADRVFFDDDPIPEEQIVEQNEPSAPEVVQRSQGSSSEQAVQILEQHIRLLQEQLSILREGVY